MVNGQVGSGGVRWVQVAHTALTLLASAAAAGGWYRADTQSARAAREGEVSTSCLEMMDRSLEGYSLALQNELKQNELLVERYDQNVRFCLRIANRCSDGIVPTLEEVEAEEREDQQRREETTR